MNKLFRGGLYYIIVHLEIRVVQRIWIALEKLPSKAFCGQFESGLEGLGRRINAAELVTFYKTLYSRTSMWMDYMGKDRTRLP